MIIYLFFTVFHRLKTDSVSMWAVQLNVPQVSNWLGFFCCCCMYAFIPTMRASHIECLLHALLCLSAISMYVCTCVYVLLNELLSATTTTTATATMTCTRLIFLCVHNVHKNSEYVWILCEFFFVDPPILVRRLLLYQCIM